MTHRLHTPPQVRCARFSHTNDFQLGIRDSHPKHTVDKNPWCSIKGAPYIDPPSSQADIDAWVRRMVKKGAIRSSSRQEGASLTLLWPTVLAHLRATSK